MDSWNVSDDGYGLCAQFIVLDEADKLFEMGRQGKELETTFLGQIDEILSACATGDHIQRALFSATIGPQIEELSLAFLRDPVAEP